MNATVRVRRENGEIETVETNFRYIDDVIFADMKKATKAAGRGELLSYDNRGNKSYDETKKYIKTTRQHFAEAHRRENRAAGRCPYCGGYCDGDCQS